MVSILADPSLDLGGLDLLFFFLKHNLNLIFKPALAMEESGLHSWLFRVFCSEFPANLAFDCGAGSAFTEKENKQNQNNLREN